MLRKLLGDTPGALSWALLALRIVTGIAFMLHGFPKIQHPFGWMGPESPVPAVFQLLAATAEFFGGMGLVVGLLTRIAAFGIMMTMIVALGLVHLPMGHSFVASAPGQSSFEIVVVYLAIAVTFQFVGAGHYSLDHWVAQRLPVLSRD